MRHERARGSPGPVGGQRAAVSSLEKWKGMQSKSFVPEFVKFMNAPTCMFSLGISSAIAIVHVAKERMIGVSKKINKVRDEIVEADLWQSPYQPVHQGRPVVGR